MIRRVGFVSHQAKRLIRYIHVHVYICFSGQTTIRVAHIYDVMV